MPNKPIIINGVDVSWCEFCEIDAIKGNSELCCKILMAHGDFNVGCYKYPDCYYKQLKRKEQECEELREQINSAEKHIKELNDIIHEMEENTIITDHYKQALDKIEKIIKNVCYGCEDCETEFSIKEWCENYEVLEIINRSKND